MLEIAQKRGMKVGDVSTAEITDATPAVLASHISLRGCQGPANMAACPLETKGAGGLGSIAEQEVDHKVDVLLGGGRGRFTQTIGSGPDTGKTVVESAQAKGYRYVTDADGLSTVANDSKPVLGLFNTGNMSLEWTGPAASHGKGNAPVPCTEGQRPANEPSLAAMTEQAIDLLDERQRARGSSCRSRAPRSTSRTTPPTPAARSARRSPSTGRSASRSTTRKTTPTRWSWSPPTTRTRARSSPRTRPAAALPTGYSTNLLTKDGQTLSLTYGTAGYGGPGAAPAAVPPSQQHTGAVVPVWASGPGGLDVLGTNDHTDLFETLGG